ncbi:MAG: PAS domain S-box protein [Pseudomonadota bacterium]
MNRENLFEELERLRRRVADLENSEIKRSKDTLNVLMQRYKAVLDNIEVGISVLDSRMQIVEVNKALRDYFPHVRPACGQVCYEHYNDPPRSEPCPYCPCVLTLHDGEVHEAVTETPEGSEIRNYRIVSSPIKDSEGRVQYVIEMTEDITGRKSAAEELKRSNDLLRAIIEAAPAAIIGVDLDGNVQGVWNPAAEKMFGRRAEEVMGRPLPAEPEERLEEFGWHRRRMSKGETLTGVEVRRRRRDGTLIDYGIYSSPLHDVEGRMTGNIAVLVDITERKRAEEQLNRLSAAVEHAGEAIVVSDSQGIILYANPAFENITGYERQEVIGKDWRILGSGKQGEALYQDMWDTVLSGRDWRGRLTNVKKDGTLYEETATVSPIKDESGRVVNFVTVIRDVTDESSLQKQLIQAQKMEAIGTLAGGIAHDFNNLLQVINGYAEMALFGIKEGDKGHSALLEIRRAARSAAELTQGLLTFSRRVESKLRPVDLNQELHKVSNMLSRTLPKMIEIRMNLSEPLDPVNADPAQLQQVVMNLAVNARDAMPDGGRLSIETRNVLLDEDYCKSHLGTSPGNYVLLSISDSGTGMDEETRKHIFDPFFTTKESGKGTGLGLAIAFGIVKSHGGGVQCYSEPGYGSTFRIYLPALKTAHDAAQTVQFEAFTSGTETILVVDDEDSVREISAEMLEKFGYTVLTAAGGREGVGVFSRERHRIDLVILDLIMPEMGGRDCLREILKIAPETKVIIASGYAANGQIDQALQDGATAVVRKPYEAGQLIGLVRKVLDEF